MQRKDAIARTDFAVAAWKQRSIEDDFHLVALLSHNASFYCKEKAMVRDRFVQILEKYSIPYVDQCETISRAGKKPFDANYRHDGHWNPQGHIWAAEALVPMLENLCYINNCSDF